MAYGFTIDLERCIGCHACSTACKAANGTPPGVTRSRVTRTTEGTYPNVKRIVTPMLCMLCGNPPCVTVCPVEGATYRRPEDGITVIDKELCNGCGYCIDACPYGARYAIETGDGYFGAQLNEYEEKAYVNMPAGTVDKCDFCLSRSSDGETPDPTCVKACITNARVFGQIEDLQGEIDTRAGFQLMPEEGTGPFVYYLPRIDK